MGKVPDILRHDDTEGIQSLGSENDISVQGFLPRRGSSRVPALRPKACSRAKDRSSDREKGQPCPELIEPFEAPDYRSATP